MATLPLKASRKERRSVIRFLWAKQLGTNAIHSKSIQYIVTIIILLDWQYMFCVKSLLRVEKVLLRRNDLAAVLFWRVMTDATIAAVRSLVLT